MGYFIAVFHSYRGLIVDSMAFVFIPSATFDLLSAVNSTSRGFLQDGNTGKGWVDMAGV